MVFSAGVLKVCVFRHREQIVKNSNVFDLRMFSYAPEMLRFSVHLHDVVNALAKIVMWKLQCLCVLLLRYLQRFRTP